MTLLIKNGRLIDPAQAVDAVLDLVVENGKVSKIGKNLSSPSAQALDATHLVVCPGFIDLHVHLREPGQEYKETIATGTRAAAAGGFTSVCCMANTDPVNDHGAITQFIRLKAEMEGVVKVYPIGALTKNLEGKELAEIGELKASGCIALSDDGKTVQNAQLMRLGMEYAKTFGLPVVSHCLCPDLTGRGVMNEGFVATEIGLRGIPHTAEEVIIARDIALSALTGTPLHIAHVSTARGVALVRDAKQRKLRVSCEVAPHHFTLTDEACRTYDPNTKMAPPLRTEKDIEAICEGLADGTIDAIATDHAPHSTSDKEVGFEEAPCGITGLETALPLSLRLVERGILSLRRMIELLTVGPAKIFNLNAGSLALGESADLVIFSLEEESIYEAQEGYSKSFNSPFDQWKMKGRVKWTIVDGKIAYPFS